ncbi:MAG: ABC transporter permease [Spirochaetaceae bacterium]|jgi:lipopolysaccharide transport system permease protein|nr:ABC transporter permease [Spirochaetaceae bacterium]
MNWDLTISAKHRIFDFKLRELIRYRDLIIMFFIRDFTVTYKQTILGPLWYIISPLCSTLIYAFLFNNIANMGTGNIPMLLFYYGGTMLWTYFSTCLNSASVIFIANANVFGKVYFPRLVTPIATTFSAVFRMLIQFAMLLVFYAYYLVTGNPVRPTIYALLFPVMIIWVGALGTGCGMIVSALTTKYRDLNNVVTLVLQLAMYVTPVVYPLEQVPQKLRWFFYCNPVSAPMELFRIWFYGSGNLPGEMILLSLGITLVVVFLGLILYTRNEKTFVDVI